MRGEGAVTFRFANLLRRSDIELLLCVCLLDKVVLLVPCCVLQISGIHCTVYFADHFSFSQFPPWMLMILTCTQLVLLSISNVLVAVWCLPRFWTPQSAVLTTGPSYMSALALCFSVEVNTHPNRQFPTHFAVHTPLCLHVLFRVARPLHSNQGVGGPSLGVFSGVFPPGCDGTVAHDHLLCKGRGVIEAYPPVQCGTHSPCGTLV